MCAGKLGGRCAEGGPQRAQVDADDRTHGHLGVSRENRRAGQRLGRDAQRPIVGEEPHQG